MCKYFASSLPLGYKKFNILEVRLLKYGEASNIRCVEVSE